MNKNYAMFLLRIAAIASLTSFGSLFAKENYIILQSFLALVFIEALIAVATLCRAASSDEKLFGEGSRLAKLYGMR